jgi:hypothetical protein
MVQCRPSAVTDVDTVDLPVDIAPDKRKGLNSSS